MMNENPLAAAQAVFPNSVNQIRPVEQSAIPSFEPPQPLTGQYSSAPYLMATKARRQMKQ